MVMNGQRRANGKPFAETLCVPSPMCAGVQASSSLCCNLGLATLSTTTSPQRCNLAQFSAKVPTASLHVLLKESGHNRAYLTLRAWNGNLLECWSFGFRATSLRSPGRPFLLRSSGALFAAKAGMGFGWPLLLTQIQFLYKVGPGPHGADEAAIVSWARTQGRRLKVLKSQRPRQWLVGPKLWLPKTGWLSMERLF